MIPIWIEAIYLVSQLVTFYRIYVQYVDSKKEKRSVNSTHYWIATILINGLVFIYGVLIGSLVMPLMIILSTPITLWHLNLEKNRDKQEEKKT